MASKPRSLKGPGLNPPPRPRKYDETELRMIRAGLAEQAKARYIRRTRGVG